MREEVRGRRIINRAGKQRGGAQFQVVTLEGHQADNTPLLGGQNNLSTLLNYSITISESFGLNRSVQSVLLFILGIEMNTRKKPAFLLYSTMLCTSDWLLHSDQRCVLVHGARVPLMAFPGCMRFVPAQHTYSFSLCVLANEPLVTFHWDIKSFEDIGVFC